MFSGIIQGVGRIASANAQGDGLRVVVDVGDLDIADVGEGDSIAVAGCCLTTVGVSGRALFFDVSAETLACTTGLDRPNEVNLEKALRLSDRLGGHLVSGHVDGVGVVTRLEPVDGEEGSRVLEIDTPASLARFIAAKGSIAIDGVSLTVNEVSGSRFMVNLIPHTLKVTTFGRRKSGDRVNLEIDLVARYVERLLASGS
ncbi:MAG TPA: riboflavin synthase [Actinomycetota bacterium]|nr:riboflavin synthase [Actinomycetota bacterium]